MSNLCNNRKDRVRTLAHIKGGGFGIAAMRQTVFTLCGYGGGLHVLEQIEAAT